MTADEVAAYLRVHRRTIYRMVKADRIPFFKIGADCRFHKKAIDQWSGEHRSREILNRRR
jgi:excisionase family DNA binding protein